MSDTTTTIDEFKLYHYEPSTVAAVIFVVLFSLTTALHLFQLIRRRTWYFIPFFIGGLFEAIGYVGRVLGSREEKDEWTTGPYIMQSLLLLVAPALFAASIYMVLGRIILITDGNSHSLIRVSWLTKFFVCGDVISFLAQSAGGGMLAQADKQSQVDLGNNIIIAGLAIQLLFFGFFIIAAAIFNIRINKVPTERSQTISIPWRRHLMVLYLTSTLIMIRSVFRIIEYVMGQDGVLLRSEIYLYIFDAAIMFVMMCLFNIWHPNFTKEDMDAGRGSVSPKKRRRHRNNDVESDGVEYAMSRPKH